MNRGKPLSFKKDKVLARAMELFWQNGYEMTSMSNLLAHMGIQRQSFYNTFGSKEKIFVEAITLYSDTMFKEFAPLLNQPGSPIENVKQMLKLWEGTIIEHGGCLLCNSIAEFSPNNRKIANLLKYKIKRVEAAFYQTFDRAKTEGYLLETSDTRALAHTFIVVAQGMALMSKLGMGKDLLPAMLKSAQALLKN
jgi:TetR/AcrR family transcriptional regulator, transcriptional repressor for nem operon